MINDDNFMSKQLFRKSFKCKINKRLIVDLCNYWIIQLIKQTKNCIFNNSGKTWNHWHKFVIKEQDFINK